MNQLSFFVLVTVQLLCTVLGALFLGAVWAAFVMPTDEDINVWEFGFWTLAVFYALVFYQERRRRWEQRP